MLGDRHTMRRILEVVKCKLGKREVINPIILLIRTIGVEISL